MPGGGTPLPVPAAGPTAATGLAGLTKTLNPLAEGITKVQKGFTDLTASAGKVASAAGLVTKPLKVVGVMGLLRDSITTLGIRSPSSPDSLIPR